MAISLQDISTGKQLRPPRIVLLGVEKIGKSTFAAGAGNPIFIPAEGEEGIDDLDVASFPPCRSLRDVLDCMTVLYNEDHDFQTVVIDSASALEPLIWDSVTREHGVDSIEKVGGGYGKGYVQALELWRQVVQGLDALRNQRGMTGILIGHVKVKHFDDPTGDGYDRYWFDVNDKASAFLFRWADSILFANTKVVVKTEDSGFNREKKRGVDITGGQRFLFTQQRPAHPGGGRGVYGRLPYELPLDWPTFMAAVKQAHEEDR